MPTRARPDTNTDRRRRAAQPAHLHRALRQLHGRPVPLPVHRQPAQIDQHALLRRRLGHEHAVDLDADPAFALLIVEQDHRRGLKPAATLRPRVVTAQGGREFDRPRIRHYRRDLGKLNALLLSAAPLPET